MRTPKEDRARNDYYGPGTPCSQCGEVIESEAPSWTEYCNRHEGMRGDF